jgi:hypothetical protein
MKYLVKLLFTIGFAILLSVVAYATDTTVTYIPDNMLPCAQIHYDENLNMTITNAGMPVHSGIHLAITINNDCDNTIKLLDDKSSYSRRELEVIYDALQNTYPVFIEDNANKIPAMPNSTVIYDGTGSIYKIVNDNNPNPRLTDWTYPSNGTYYYGTWNPQNWIQITDSYIMGQGYVTYFNDTWGYHGDNLDQMELNDLTLNICATKMAYDRPNRAQSIRLRVLDDYWYDTTSVYYVNKYDIGGLPEAVLDIRERLFSQITNLNNGIFHGRYYYDRVPLTDPY